MDNMGVSTGAGIQAVTAVVLFITTVVAAQNLIRYLVAKNWNGAAGICLAALGGFAVAELGAHASVTSGMTLIENAPALGLLDTGSLILLGVALGSGGVFAWDHIQAKDATQTAAKPPLIPTKQPDPNDFTVPPDTSSGQQYVYVDLPPEITPEAEPPAPESMG